MPIYCGEENHNLMFFGLNSAGMSDTKRMLGTMGNPNNNGIVFLFFCMLYAADKTWKTKNIIFFFIAIIMLIACQSRTTLIAFFCMIFANYIFSKIPIKLKIIQIFSIISLVIIITNINVILGFLNIKDPFTSSKYLSTLVDNKAFESYSWEKRLEVWSSLSKKSLEKPILGHSPDKEFFYKNKIYADNEYILVLYRYGIIGLLLYLLILTVPPYHAFRLARSNIEAKNAIMISIIFAVSAITNAPFNNSIIVFFYIFTIANFYALKI